MQTHTHTHTLEHPIQCRYILRLLQSAYAYADGGGYGGALVQPSRLTCWIQSCGMMGTFSGVLRVYYRTSTADSRPPSGSFRSENLNCGNERIQKEENNMSYLMSGLSKPSCFSQLQFSLHCKPK